MQRAPLQKLHSPRSSYVFSQFSSSFLFFSPQTPDSCIFISSAVALWLVGGKKPVSALKRFIHTCAHRNVQAYTHKSTSLKKETQHIVTLLRCLLFCWSEDKVRPPRKIQYNMSMNTVQILPLTLAHFCSFDIMEFSFLRNAIFFRLITSVLLLAWGQFFCPQNLANSFESFKRKQSIHLFFLLLLSGHWRTHSDLGYVVFLKPQTCLALLSQTLITDSHNSQPVDSHQQTPLGVTYTPFLPLPLYSSTASGLRQIDRRGSESRETREEERGLMGMDKVRKEDAENIFSQHQKRQTS